MEPQGVVRGMNVTNLQNEGWISADRGTKATLMRTIPRSILGRIRRICLFQYLQELLSPTHHHFQVGCGPCNRMILDHIDLKLFFITWEKLRIATFSRDSGLEAFSRNPTHGSFSALTFQSTDLPIMWTNGSSRTKLDYCRGDLSSVG